MHRVVRIDPATTQITPLDIQVGEQGYLSRLPDGTALLNLGVSGETGSPLVRLLPDGGQQTVDIGPDIPAGSSYSLLPGQPGDRAALFSIFNLSQQLRDFASLDLDACDSGDCQLSLGINEQKVTSPNTAEGLPLLLDNVSYDLTGGNPEGTGRDSVALYDIDGEAVFEITTDDLLEILPAPPDDEAAYSITALHTGPVNLYWLLVEARLSSSPEEVFLLAYNWRIMGHMWLMAQRPMVVSKVLFSEDGAWAAVAGYNRNNGQQSLLLSRLNSSDQISQTSSNYPYFVASLGWSDSGWLVRGEEHFLALLHPDTDALHVIVPPDGSCRHPVWLP